MESKAQRCGMKVNWIRSVHGAERSRRVAGRLRSVNGMTRLSDSLFSSATLRSAWLGLWLSATELNVWQLSAHAHTHLIVKEKMEWSFFLFRALLIKYVQMCWELEILKMGNFP